MKDFYSDAQFYTKSLEEHKIIVDKMKEKKDFQNTLYEMSSQKHW